ncbi:MAG: M64 family metallopeptidase, partial [Prevotella sp.]
MIPVIASTSPIWPKATARRKCPNFWPTCARPWGALFAHEPFKSLQGKFSIVAVESPSSDSGTSEPSKGIWKQTALGSH